MSDTKRQNKPRQTLPVPDGDPFPVEDMIDWQAERVFLRIVAPPTPQPRPRFVPVISRRGKVNVRPVSIPKGSRAWVWQTLALEQLAQQLALGSYEGPIIGRRQIFQMMTNADGSPRGIAAHFRFIMPTVTSRSVIARPQYHRSELWGQPHLQKPDFDNLAKLVLDTLMEAGALGHDDATVTKISGEKVWGGFGETRIWLSPILPRSSEMPQDDPIAAAQVVRDPKRPDILLPSPWLRMDGLRG